MNKELIDRAWVCLPREFKEEVKKLYTKFYNEKPHSDCSYGYLGLLIKLFGIHNLTSDAEGEEDEMLYVSRKKLQYFYERLRKVGENHAAFALQSLFGSKCLPDETCNVASSNPKPAEPEFKVGDGVVWDKRIKAKVAKILNDGDCIIYSRVGNRYTVHESALEPYTDPEEDLIPSNSGELNTQEADNQSRNLSQETANCDKQFDNILKDGFSKERRLNIATTIIGYIIQNGFYSLAEKYREENINNIVKLSMQITDTLIAEAEEGGAK